MKLIFHFILSTVAILIAAYLIPGVDTTLTGAAVAAVVLALLSLFIKPLVVLLTLPINILTLGLFSLVINAGLVLATDYFVADFSVDGFWWALLFGLVLSLINLLFGIKSNWGSR